MTEREALRGSLPPALVEQHPRPPEAAVASTALEPTPELVERRRRRGIRGVGSGVLLWALPIVLVLGIAVAAVGWYARKDYYVGASQGQP